MEKELKSARNLVNKILQSIKRNDLDWTVQISINSTRPDRVNYCCQIESPASGLEPVTWVCESWEELKKQLEIAVKCLNPEAVEKAWHQSEIARAEALIKYHKEILAEKEETEKKPLENA